MWYYIFVAFIILGSLIFARINSAYHPDLLVKKHIVLKSKKAQLFFISQSNPLDMKIDNRKEYRNKLTVLGLTFYILWLGLLVFSILFLIFGPRTTIEPVEFDDGIFVSALNQAVVLMLALVFLGFEMAFYFLNIIKSPSVNENKVIRVLWIVVIISVFFISFAGIVEAVKIFLNYVETKADLISSEAVH